MIHYLRLFFVGKILFVCLGLSEQQYSGITASEPIEQNVTSTSLQAGILPSSLTGYELIVPEGSLLLTHKYSETQKQKDHIATRNTLVRFQLVQTRYLECRPGIFLKTGQTFHLPTGVEDPSFS